MENRNNIEVTSLSEEIVTEILARLPLRSISRFKSVCRTWKSTLESSYFRRLFLSLHQNKSRSWSLVCGYMIDYHRCQTWGLPNSVSYYLRNIFERNGNAILWYKDSSNGLVLIQEEYKGTYYVGNPILQQWVAIPIPTPDSCTTRLVTRVDEDGVVLSFKVVTIDAVSENEDRSSTSLYFFVYSSETGIWTRRQLHCPHYFSSISPPIIITLHVMLYIRPDDNDVIIAHDFYGESNVCAVIPLPDPDPDPDSNNHESLTTSTEFVFYMKTLPNNVLKVWRLVDNAWEPLWETRLEFIPCDDNLSSYAPVTMHPFDRNIIYLWSYENNHLVSCNLKTQNYHIFIDQLQGGDLQNCFGNHSICEKHTDGLCALYLRGARRINYSRFEYVFPRWMGSIPCPPGTELLDTTSLLFSCFSMPFILSMYFGHGN